MVISELTEVETRVLRVLYDRDGEAAFDDAASTILVHTAALIGHVRGPRRLRDTIVLGGDDHEVYIPDVGRIGGGALHGEGLGGILRQNSRNGNDEEPENERQSGAHGHSLRR